MYNTGESQVKNLCCSILIGITVPSLSETILNAASFIFRFFLCRTARNGATWSPDAEHYKQFDVPLLIPELNATNKWKMIPLNLQDPPIEKKIRNINLNFGPQHPAAHGVLRLVLELDGEVSSCISSSYVTIITQLMYFLG